MMTDPFSDSAKPSPCVLDRFGEVRRASYVNNERSRAFQLPNPAKSFSASYLLKLAESLELNHISILLNAEGLREKGLQLVRANRFSEAGEMLSQANALCAQADLPQHAIFAAQSFQAAADAYLFYRTGDHSAAVTMLEEALETCRALGNEFGHDVEFRKVHLGRNMLRARCFIDSRDEIISSAVGMLYYILGDYSQWPCGGGAWTVHRSLTPSELLWSVDETFCNLAVPEVALAGGVIEEPKGAAAQEAGMAAATHDAALAWARAFIAEAENELAAFLDNSKLFLYQDSGGLRHMKRILMERLDRRFEEYANSFGLNNLI